MDSEAAPELIFDQGSGLYYPAASDYYGYYYTGPEPLNDWDSHHQFFGLDGQDLHISAMQTESLPNVYYIPSYGYVQSPYNPYNPSIPGAVIGTEGSFIETPYPANPPHQLVVSSPAYIPVGFDSSSVAVPNSYLNPFLTSTGALPATKPDGEGKRLAPSPPLAPMNKGAASLVVASEHLASRAFHPSSYQSIATPKLQEASVANAIATKQSSGGALASGSIPGVNQASNPLANVKVSSVYRPAKVALPASNGFPNYGSSFSQWTTGSTGDKYRPRFQINDGWASKSGNLTEQNRGPRTDISKCRWTSPLYLKAYTTKAGTGDSQGNIIISADRYNRDDFPIDYEEAKCFVIKSYSEDDVHKSIKYNVWSSTPSGNKRLDNAFGEAQKLSAGRPQKCPIFLFFSVNASGQFCGVAEMMGPVDFQKDMDFWQQDKWLGSFPVKWHIIKDVSNISLRHILLENNEYKPVTCSRDTQEIPLLQGMAMLRIFKNAPLETSILDDFMHYEERQRIWFEEKTRIYGRRYDPQFFPAAFVPSRRVDAVVEEDTTATAEEPAESAVKETSAAAAEQPTESDEREPGNGCDGEPLKLENQQNGIVVQGSPDENRRSSANCGYSNVQLDSTSKAVQGGCPSKPRDLVILGGSLEQLDADGGVNSVMKIGSLHIDSKSGDDALSISAQNDVITVGSMHIKVGKHACPPGVLTVGSIPIAPNGF